MSKSIAWLDKYAEQLKQQNEMSKKTANVKTASAKTTETKNTKAVTASRIKKANKIILRKDVLPKAVNDNTVKYNGYIWKVINASYKDKKGTGVVLQKLAEVSTKKITDPEERAFTDPGDVYDYEVRDSFEVPELQSTADNTAKRISQENAVDRTTPAGRAQNPYVEEENIFNDVINEDFGVSEDEEIEDSVGEDVPAEHNMEEVEDTVTEDTVTEDDTTTTDNDFEQELIKDAEENMDDVIEGEADVETDDTEGTVVESDHDVADTLERTSKKEASKDVKNTKRQNPILKSIISKTATKKVSAKKTVSTKSAKRENPILKNICK